MWSARLSAPVVRCTTTCEPDAVGVTTTVTRSVRVDSGRRNQAGVVTSVSAMLLPSAASASATTQLVGFSRAGAVAIASRTTSKTSVDGPPVQAIPPTTSTSRRRQPPVPPAAR